MAPMEMIQTDLPLSVAQPTTPPSTPTPSSTEHDVALNNVPQLTKMVKTIVAMEIASIIPASKFKCPHTPPEAPGQQASPQPLTVEHLENLFLKLIDYSKSRHSLYLKLAPTPKQRVDYQGYLQSTFIS